MDTQRIEVSREEAEAYWRDYQKDAHWSEPIDREIAHVYEALAKGKTFIRAIDSIVAAGLGEDKLPKLAIVRADAPWCYLYLRQDGGARFSVKESTPDQHRNCYVDVPAGSFPEPGRWRYHRAMTPLIPLSKRPRRGLAKYSILFEAEWSRVVPRDPMLLRRVGQSDLWLLCAAWDLTEVERAVLASRLRS